MAKEFKNGIESLVGQAVLRYGSKHSTYCFDQYLKNHLAYLNSNAFEFLGQLTLRGIYYFSKGVNNFEISTKHANFGITLE